MKSIKIKARWSGVLIILGMVAGVFSVAPSVDSPSYLTEATGHSGQVIIAAVFQLMMAFAYLAFAILMYSLTKSFGKELALGFLCSRIVAVAMVVLGAVALVAILALSNEYINTSSSELSNEYINTSSSEIPFFYSFGNVLKATRDYINHVFMILILSCGNFLMYILFLQSKLVPRWISMPGLAGTVSSVVASLLVLFQVLDVITSTYLLLNVPTALLELILALWLIFDGSDLGARDQDKQPHFFSGFNH